MFRRPPRFTLFPYTMLFRSVGFFFKQFTFLGDVLIMKFTKTTIEICGKDFKYANCTNHDLLKHQKAVEKEKDLYKPLLKESKELENEIRDRKSTRLNSSHQIISY